MKKTVFTGSGVAIVTPMHQDGTVNFEEWGRVLEFQIENGTDAIIICGTTGESATLNHEEHCQVIRYAIEKVNHRIPVIAGSGSNDTAYAIELSQEAEKMGADALLVVTPYYNKTSQAGLIKHYHMIADSVNIPIIVYNVPSRTGCAIQPQTYLVLAKHPNICGIKEANGNISAIAQTIALCGDMIDIYSGNDDQIVPIMSLGGKGVISVFANVCPKESHDLTEAMLQGNMKKGAELQLKYLELMNDLFMDVNPIPVKEAMNMMGFQCGPCRMPLVEMSDAAKAKLKDCLRRYGLIQ